MLRRPPPRGFTLVEMMATLTMAGILLAIGIPSVRQLGTRGNQVVMAQQVATAVQAARERAALRGGCTVVDVSNNVVRIRESGLRDCEKDVSAMTLTHVLPLLDVRGDAGGVVTFTSNSNNQAPELVWRPTGWARGNDYGTNALTLSATADTWRMDITDRRLPASRNTLQVVVDPMGLVCVVQAVANTAGVCP